MKYKMVASDLDGTLLGADQRVSKENLEAIKEISELGVKFVPATGRCLGEMPDDVRYCENVKYIITSDGAMVWDNERGEVALAKYIPRDLVKFIVDEMNKYKNYPMVHASTDSYVDKAKHNPLVIRDCHVNEYFVSLIEKRNIAIDGLDAFASASDEVELFCVFFENNEILKEFEAKMLATGRLCVAQSAPYNVEIYAKDAGKGNTLKALAEKFDIGIDEVIAVGDSRNDVSLVSTAGLGLAMENACDELKAVADEVICHCRDHSAKYILDHYIK